MAPTIGPGTKQARRRAVAALAALVGLAMGFAAIAPAKAAGPETTETIVMVRHGEKPAAGLGQLDCQGLNRALALPPVIANMFGAPAAIFAPDPSEQKPDGGKPYDYVRPLATIEPTAIALGMPIDASIGVSRIDDLQLRLDAAPYVDAFILIAWEHEMITRLARGLMAAHGGDAGVVPDWNGADFDGVYVVRIMRSEAGTRASFERRQEGLDGQSMACPGPAAR
jgi:hypothetical protein